MVRTNALKTSRANALKIAAWNVGRGWNNLACRAIVEDLEFDIIGVTKTGMEDAKVDAIVAEHLKPLGSRKLISDRILRLTLKDLKINIVYQHTSTRVHE